MFLCVRVVRVCAPSGCVCMCYARVMCMCVGCICVCCVCVCVVYARVMRYACTCAYCVVCVCVVCAYCVCVVCSELHVAAQVPAQDLSVMVGSLVCV